MVRADSGADALDALHEIKLRGEQVAVVLAHYRMPQMNGIQFLEQAMDLFPLARRALLTRTRTPTPRRHPGGVPPGATPRSGCYFR